MAHGSTRMTLRAPEGMRDRVEKLVRSGEYPNQSEVVREGLRELYGHYDFSHTPPNRRPRRRPEPAVTGADGNGTPPASQPPTVLPDGVDDSGDGGGGMDRITLRVPTKMREKAEELVEAGEYPNQSEVLRAGLRELFAYYKFSLDPPVRMAPGTAVVVSDGADSRATRDARARASNLLRTIGDRADDAPPVIILDEAGATEGLRRPAGSHIVRDGEEFKKKVRELG